MTPWAAFTSTLLPRESAPGKKTTRVSTPRKPRAGTGQRQRGLAVASVAREVFSSGELHRPQLDAMIARLQPGDVLLAHKPDRLTRHQKHPHILEYLIEQQGARLAYVTQDAATDGRGHSALERRELHKRIGAGADSGADAERTPRPPRQRQAERRSETAVWSCVGRCGREEGRQVAARAGPRNGSGRPRHLRSRVWRARRCAGSRSALTERGILTPSGGTRWSATTIREILGKRVYTGTALAYQHRYDRLPGGRYKRRPARAEEQIALPDVAPAIVSEAEQAAVLARLQRNQAESTRRNPNPEATLLRCGHVYCGHCGLAMTVVNRHQASCTGSQRIAVARAVRRAMTPHSLP